MLLLQGQLEESCVRQNLTVASLRDRQIAANSTAYELEISQAELAVDKALLQLIQTACKADKLARALDLATLLASTKSIESAAQIANFYHLPGLKEKISALRAVKEDELDDRDDADRRRRENGARWGTGNAGRYVPQGTEYDYVTGNAHLPPRTELYARAAVPDFAPRPVGGRKAFNRPSAATYSPAPPSAPSSRFTLNSEVVEAADDSYGAYSPPPAGDENDDDDGMDLEIQDLDEDEQRAANAKRRREADESFGEPADRRKRASVGGESSLDSASASKARELPSRTIVPLPRSQRVLTRPLQPRPASPEEPLCQEGRQHGRDQCVLSAFSLFQAVPADSLSLAQTPLRGPTSASPSLLQSRRRSLTASTRTGTSRSAVRFLPQLSPPFLEQQADDRSPLCHRRQERQSSRRRRRRPRWPVRPQADDPLWPPAPRCCCGRRWARKEASRPATGQDEQADGQAVSLGGGRCFARGDGC